MGGWVTAMTASTDAALRQTREQLVALMADDMDSLAGVTPETMADEIIANAKEFSIANAASGLAKLPLLVITSDDGYAPVAAALVIGPRGVIHESSKQTGR